MTKHLTRAQAHRLHAAMLEDLEARGWLNDGAGGPEPEPVDPYPRLPAGAKHRVEESDGERLSEAEFTRLWWRASPTERKRLLAEVEAAKRKPGTGPGSG